MKNLSKKSVSLLIAITLLVTPLLSVVGNAAKYNEDCPYVYVHGFMATSIYEDPDDPDSKTVWPPEGDAIKDTVLKALPKLLKFLIFRNHKQLGEDLLPIADELLSPAYLDNSGEVPNKSGVRFEYPDKSELTKNTHITFCYDWRVSPIETAAKLNDFINYLLEATGCEQVVLECHSYGGVIANTYAKLYGTSKVRSWVFNSTAVYGETYTGELMTGQMVFDPDSITAYFHGAFDYNKNDNALIGLFEVLNLIGVTDVLCKMVNHLLLKLGPQLMGEALLPMFGRWLSIWAMVPDEMFNDAYAYVFDNIYKNDNTDRSGLQAKILEYNEKVRADKADTLRYINETSNLYVISRYGYSAFFMTPSWKNASDMVIDVKYNSFGATVADYGSVLTNEEIKGVDKKYISPDGTVNASTCMFPKQTWFVRHMTHSDFPDSMDELSLTLLYYDGQATIDTFKEYPGFLYYDEDTDLIVPDTLYDEKLSLKEKFKNIFKK